MGSWRRGRAAQKGSAEGLHNKGPPSGRERGVFTAFILLLSVVCVSFSDCGIRLVGLFFVRSSPCRPCAGWKDGKGRGLRPRGGLRGGEIAQPVEPRSLGSRPGGGWGVTGFTAKVVSPAVVSPAEGQKRCGWSEVSLSTGPPSRREESIGQLLRATGYRL